MCYRTGKSTVCRSVRASFSPEILKAGAVKGLMKIISRASEKKETKRLKGFALLLVVFK